MAKFHFRICDASHHVLGENDLEAPDVATACRDVLMASALFMAKQNIRLDGTGELADAAGDLVASIDLSRDAK